MGRVASVLLMIELVALGAAGVSSQAPEPSLATPSALELLSGSYRYVGDAAKDHATIQRSIESAVTSLGWLGRKIAANRLANHKELPQRIEISQSGQSISIVMGKYSAVAPIDGSERELVGPNGRDSKLHYELSSEEIAQFFVFEHAKRKSTYRLDDSGQLVMTVYMTSEKLATPIEYALVYAAEQ